jgi:hypothetical protein
MSISSSNSNGKAMELQAAMEILAQSSITDPQMQGDANLWQ